jgi:hypothetical protein
MHHADKAAVKDQICKFWSFANAHEAVENDRSRAMVLASIARACSFRLYAALEGVQYKFDKSDSVEHCLCVAIATTS